MAILQDTTPTPVKKGPSCTLGVILHRLDDDDRARLQTWLDADTYDYAHTWVAERLTEVGYRIHSDTVGRHRRGQCRCGVT